MLLIRLIMATTAGFFITGNYALLRGRIFSLRILFTHRRLLNSGYIALSLKRLCIRKLYVGRNNQTFCLFLCAAVELSD